MINSAKSLCDRIAPDVEKVMESLLIEIDRNLLFSLAFSETMPDISELCDKIAEDSALYLKKLGRMLLLNGCNPTLRLYATVSSVDACLDKPSKVSCTALSVINHNLGTKRKIAAYLRAMISRDGIRKYTDCFETLNHVYLEELKSIENLQTYLN